MVKLDPSVAPTRCIRSICIQRPLTVRLVPLNIGRLVLSSLDTALSATPNLVNTQRRLAQDRASIRKGLRGYKEAGQQVRVRGHPSGQPTTFWRYACPLAGTRCWRPITYPGRQFVEKND